MIWATGIFTLALTHGVDLSQAGGLHYDEAWAALFSHRIATQAGFWPVAAMSPYTSAWSHYVAALFFKLFGVSLLVYRLSGIALVVAGVSLLSAALRNARQPLAAGILPWVLAFFSAALINHRFVIEINTFHVFCLGLLAWGMSLKLFPEKHLIPWAKPWVSDAAILAGAVLGITSHVLFLAPALACLIVAFWNDTFLSGQRERWLAAVSLLLLSGFFLRIHLGIPEKGKSLALLLISSLSLVGVLFPKLASVPIHSAKKVAEKPIDYAFFALSSVALFFLLFFSEGSWAAAFFNGGASKPLAMIWPLAALAIAAWGTRKSFVALFHEDARWRKIFSWALLTVILVSVMATKPAPRYFEIPFLLLACGLSIALAILPRRVAMIAAFIWILGGALQIELNYLRPSLSGEIPERSFRFLFFKDGSSDTLSKQQLVRFLANSGCRFDQVASGDIRIMDPLRFLSLGDWHASGNCKLGSRVTVERKSQANGAENLSKQEFGPFVLYTSQSP